MVPAPFIDFNKWAHSYTHLQVDRPYIALNSETYISLRHQELRMCKNIGYKFYCEELFIVKHKSKCSCKSAIYFNLGCEIIKENCDIEVENHFLLESLAVCHDTNSKLVIYFMVNTASINYIDNLTNSLTFPILLNWTTHEQTLPISLH